ncbi:MAG: hypothetical protein PHH48_08740, partial [Eubacteriales bacterium]|nr:hypothetical protein [Eubacteriales bacterium]
GLYRSNSRQNGIADIDFILNMLSENRGEALKSYIAFMDEKKKEDIDVFEKVDKIGEVNTKTIEEYIKSDTKPLNEILKDLVKDEQIYNEIKKGSRRRYLSAYKKEFIDTALKFNYTMKEIGESISISGSAVYKIHHEEKQQEENDGFDSEGFCNIRG